VSREHIYSTYILASRSHNFYIGVTRDLHVRVLQHKNGTCEGFTSHYNINRLVHYELFQDVRDAIIREKQIKRWTREKKIWLIERRNPTWQDLSEGWFRESDLVPKSTADPSTRTRVVPPRPPSG
jgi:putative endonuclease